jgi:hypothetical protein
VQFVLPEKTQTCSGRILRSWAIKIVPQLLPAVARRQCLPCLAAVDPRLCRATDPPTRTRCARTLTGQRVPWSAVSLSSLRSTRKTTATASTHRLGDYFCRRPYNLLWNRKNFLRFRFRFRLLASYGSGFGSGSGSGSGAGSISI